MLTFPLRLPVSGGAPLQVLCLGAHSDDIEIGCGGTVLQLAAADPPPVFHWIVFSGDEERAREARQGASLFLRGACEHEVVVGRFRDGFFPYVGAEIKMYFEELKERISPHLIFTHYRDDRHQDHRVISDLTWNTFRDHLILEYETPKYDGDLGSPNCYVPLDEAAGAAKTEYLLSAFASQRGKRWFSAETFRGLMHLRAIEAGGSAPYAEAFYARKLALAARTPGEP